MRIIGIGDTHGKSIWKEIVSKEKDADLYICIGDYVDSFNISGGDQLTNLQDIIQYKKDNMEKVVLLIGNHDFQYYPGSPDIGNYSGYQPTMLASFQQLYDENKKLFKMCYVHNNIVFSHAGFTETFVEQKIGTFSEGNVNDIFFYSPKSFKFYNEDRSSGGDDIHQSCIWVRPQSLDKDAISQVQVIGHTSIKHIDLAKSKRRGYYMIDCLDTVNEYLILDNNEFSVGKL